MTDATTVLRNAIGMDVVMGVAVSALSINDITGRVRAVHGGRVQLDDPSLVDRGILDEGLVARHVSDWGIR